MSEFEIVELIQTHYDRIWVVIQFWGGVSLAVIGVSYIAAEKLNIGLVVALLSLYTSFSMFTLGTVYSDSTLAHEYLLDLLRLKEEGAVLASGTEMLIQQTGTDVADLVTAVALVGTYVAVVAYLIYSYIKQRGVT